MTAAAVIPPRLDPAEPDALRLEADALGRALRAQLEYFETLGVTGWPRDLLPPRPPARPRAAAPSSPARPSAPAPPAAPRRPETAEADHPALWAPTAPDRAELERRVAACQACPLARVRSSAPAPGRGSDHPRLAVVGPDPGLHGGPRGELLSAMLGKGLELSPDEYYITSLAKCSPPDGDEPPLPAVRACRPVLLRELALTRPPIVLALGELTGRQLTGREEPLGLLRPASHPIEGLAGVWLRVTYGLDHLMDSIELKREAWKDLLKIKQALGRLRDSGNGRPA